MKTILALTIAAALALPAVADRAPVSQGLVVPAIYNTETAEKAFDTLKVAAQRACSDVFGTRMHAKADRAKCEAEAIRDGVKQIGDARLAAVAKERGL